MTQTYSPANTSPANTSPANTSPANTSPAQNAGLPLPTLHAQTTARARGRRRSERAEGVISTAIAVLVIAVLGALMWVAFQQIFNDATAKTRTQIEQIGG